MDPDELRERLSRRLTLDAPHEPVYGPVDEPVGDEGHSDDDRHLERVSRLKQNMQAPGLDRLGGGGQRLDQLYSAHAQGW